MHSATVAQPVVSQHWGAQGATVAQPTVPHGSPENAGDTVSIQMPPMTASILNLFNVFISNTLNFCLEKTCHLVGLIQAVSLTCFELPVNSLKTNELSNAGRMETGKELSL